MAQAQPPDAARNLACNITPAAMRMVSRLRGNDGALLAPHHDPH